MERPNRAAPSWPLILAVAVLTFGLLSACGDDGTADSASAAASTTQSDQTAPSPEEPAPSVPAGVHVWDFSASPPAIEAGDCTTVQWDVETVLPVTIDGFDVPTAGAYEMCLDVTTDFHLHAGGELVARLTVRVGAPSEPPPSQTTVTQPQQTTTTKPQQTTTTTTTQPPVQPPIPANCYDPNNAHVFLTDLAITDIYAGNAPLGQIWVRVTNNGPYACNNVNFGWLGCALEIAPIGSVTSEYKAYSWSGLVLNIAPGETQNIPTNIGVDFDKAFYHLACDVFMGGNGSVGDPNLWNNAYAEWLP